MQGDGVLVRGVIFLNSTSFATRRGGVVRGSGEEIKSTGRDDNRSFPATSCEAHFALFKNLMKAKQRMRRERSIARETRVALALNGSRRRRNDPGKGRRGKSRQTS